MQTWLGFRDNSEAVLGKIGIINFKTLYEVIILKEFNPFDTKNDYVTEDDYRNAIQQEIINYLKVHKRADECTHAKILQHISDNDDIIALNEKRGYSKRKGKGKPTNKYRYMVDKALQELIDNGAIVERKEKIYALATDKTIVYNLNNTDVAIFYTGKDRADDVKTMIEKNIVDKNIVVIPTESFLFCVRRNADKYFASKSQSQSIKRKVENALSKAGCDIYIGLKGEEQKKDTKNNRFVVDKPKNENQFKEQLRKLLDKDYHYYYFDQKVTIEDDTHRTKRFLMLNCNPMVVDDVYNLLIEMSEMKSKSPYENVYLGFTGITIIFDITATKKNFNAFLESIKKD